MIKKIALILPLISGILWGATGIYVRTLTDAGFDNITIVGSKMVIAVILLFAGMMIYDRNSLKVKLKDLWLLAASGVFGMLLLNMAYNTAVKSLTLSFAAVLLSLSPVFVMIFARFVFREEITKKKIICTVMAVFGCVLVSGVVEGSSFHFSFTGILLGVFAAVCYALFNIFSKLAMQRGYNVFTITFYGLITTTVFVMLFPDYGVIGDFICKAPLANSVFMIIYSLATCILPTVLYTLALSYADAGKVAIIGSGGEPSAAMVFGFIFYNEVPSLLSVTGMIITIIALAILCSPDKDDVQGGNS